MKKEVTQPEKKKLYLLDRSDTKAFTLFEINESECCDNIVKQFLPSLYMMTPGELWREQINTNFDITKLKIIHMPYDNNGDPCEKNLNEISYRVITEKDYTGHSPIEYPTDRRFLEVEMPNYDIMVIYDDNDTNPNLPSTTNDNTCTVEISSKNGITLIYKQPGEDDRWLPYHIIHENDSLIIHYPDSCLGNDIEIIFICDIDESIDEKYLYITSELSEPVPYKLIKIERMLTGYNLGPTLDPTNKNFYKLKLPIRYYKTLISISIVKNKQAHYIKIGESIDRPMLIKRPYDTTYLNPCDHDIMCNEGEIVEIKYNFIHSPGNLESHFDIYAPENSNPIWKDAFIFTDMCKIMRFTMPLSDITIERSGIDCSVYKRKEDDKMNNIDYSATEKENSNGVVGQFEIPDELAKELSENLIKQTIRQRTLTELVDDSEKYDAAEKLLIPIVSRIEVIKNTITEKYVPEEYRSNQYIWNYDGYEIDGNKISIYNA